MGNSSSSAGAAIGSAGTNGGDAHNTPGATPPRPTARSVSSAASTPPEYSGPGSSLKQTVGSLLARAFALPPPKPPNPLEEWAAPSGVYGARASPWGDAGARYLIGTRQLAPRLRGCEEDDKEGTSECPVCCLGYPDAYGLNETCCCHRALCSDCFLFSQDPGYSHDCPFCKRPSFAVEYHGDVALFLRLAAAGTVPGGAPPSALRDRSGSRSASGSFSGGAPAIASPMLPPIPPTPPPPPHLALTPSPPQLRGGGGGGSGSSGRTLYGPRTPQAEGSAQQFASVADRDSIRTAIREQDLRFGQEALLRKLQAQRDAVAAGGGRLRGGAQSGGGGEDGDDDEEEGDDDDYDDEDEDGDGTLDALLHALASLGMRVDRAGLLRATSLAAEAAAADRSTGSTGAPTSGASSRAGAGSSLATPPLTAAAVAASTSSSLPSTLEGLAAVMEGGGLTTSSSGGQPSRTAPRGRGAAPSASSSPLSGVPSRGRHGSGGEDDASAIEDLFLRLAILESLGSSGGPPAATSLPSAALPASPALSPLHQRRLQRGSREGGREGGQPATEGAERAGAVAALSSTVGGVGAVESPADADARELSDALRLSLEGEGAS